jgi:hypothetical protein
VCCQVELSATDRSLVQSSPTLCGVSLCSRNLKNEAALAYVGLLHQKKKKASHVIIIHTTYKKIRDSIKTAASFTKLKPRKTYSECNRYDVVQDRDKTICEQQTGQAYQSRQQRGYRRSTKARASHSCKRTGNAEKQTTPVNLGRENISPSALESCRYKNRKK